MSPTSPGRVRTWPEPATDRTLGPRLSFTDLSPNLRASPLSSPIHCSFAVPRITLFLVALGPVPHPPSKRPLCLLNFLIPVFISELLVCRPGTSVSEGKRTALPHGASTPRGRWTTHKPRPGAGSCTSSVCSLCCDAKSQLMSPPLGSLLLSDQCHLESVCDPRTWGPLAAEIVSTRPEKMLDGYWWNEWENKGENSQGISRPRPHRGKEAHSAR